MTETQQIALLLTLTATGFFIAVSILLAERWLRANSPRSANFVTANAGSHLRKKFSRLIEPGVQVIIPTGTGGYPLALTDQRRLEWQECIRQWTDSGAEVAILITSPGERAVQFWEALLRDAPSSLKVYLFDRTLASEDDVRDIAALDRFHPALAIKGNQPIGMWVENDHPPESAVAYNVEFVAKNDIVELQRERFDRYLRVLRRLMSGTQYVRILVGSRPTQTNYEARAA